MSENKFVDEAWKDNVEQEKGKKESMIITPDSFDNDENAQVVTKEPVQDECCGKHETCEHEQAQGLPEINFSGYVTSLAYQALIFMGEIPHPMTNQTEKNYDQAKLIIDTLVLLREKTKGNLTQEEEPTLSGCIYELQMKYVEKMKNEATPPEGEQKAQKNDR